MINIGQRITAIRTAQGLSQAALARKLGISQEYIYKLESGLRPNPTVNTLVALADALQVPVAALVAQEETAQPAA